MKRRTKKTINAKHIIKKVNVQHIIFDAIGCDKKLIGNEKFIFKLLMEVPKIIGMKILTGPHLVRDYDKRNLGITGFAIINFSHISIHTFTKTGIVFMDIFSCRKFNSNKIRKYLYKNLKIAQKQVVTKEIIYPWETQKEK